MFTCAISLPHWYQLFVCLFLFSLVVLFCHQQLISSHLSFFPCCYVLSLPSLCFLPLRFSALRCVWLWLLSEWLVRTAWWRTWRLWKRWAPPPPSALTRQAPWPRTGWLWPTCGLTTRSTRPTPPKTSLVRFSSLLFSLVASFTGQHPEWTVPNA